MHWIIVAWPPTVTARTEAWRWLLAGGEREYSFVDATRFAVMRRRRIHGALAFDRDFNLAAFVEVRPGPI